ncbi:hypothetical protein ACIPX0_48990 [Streptomyces sp. NPDC090075]|uniref:hypothetical protein n=1 Tax=Streptomyces sp. NPDC090075 TaxID=3365937 RepID=UPI0037F692D2
MRRPRRRRGGWPPPRAGTLDLACPAPTALPGYSFTLTLNHVAYGWEPAHFGAQPTARTRLRDALVIALREADPTAPATLHHAQTTP